MPGFGQATYGGAAYVPLVTGTNAFRNFWAATKVEIGFGSTALADPPTWTDVTVYVRQIQTNRGRQHELSRFEAGTAQLVLNNRDGRFSSWNTSSPYSPNVLPFVQVRITAVWDGVTYPVFRGHIDAWPLKWTTANDSDVTVHCVDATKMLNLKKASSLSNYAATVLADSPTRYWRLNDPGGTTVAADSSGNGANATVINNAASGVSDIPAAFGAATAIVASSSSGFDCGNSKGMIVKGVQSESFGASFTVEAWVKLRNAGGQIFKGNNAAKIFYVGVNDGSISGTVRGTIVAHSDNGSSIVNVNGLVPVDNGNWHHVVVVSTAATSIAIYVDGVLDQSLSTATTLGASALSTGFGGDPTIFGGEGGTPSLNGLLNECAVYASTPLTGTQIANHYAAGALPHNQELSGARVAALLDAVGWPATLRAIDTGNAVLQSADNSVVTSSVLTNLQTIGDTEGGQLFISGDGKVVFYGRSHTSASPNGLPAVTLGDSGTTGPAGESPYLVETVDIQFDDLDLYNETSVTPAGQGAQIFGDTTSQTTYGKRTLAKATVHYSAVEALGQATWNTNVYKNPLQRIRSLTFEPKDDPSVLFPDALGFELLTRIQFKRRPKDGSSSTFTQQALIEGIEHVITPGGWQTTWRLSPTDASPLMWIIDDPVAGKIVDGATQNPPVAIGY